MPKLLQCRILKASKIDVNGQVAKAKVQTTTKYIKFDAWAREQVPKGVMQKQTSVTWQ